MRKLTAAKPGETVTVIKIGGHGPAKRRIAEMGITKDTVLFVRSIAPLGDPIEVTMRGYVLSLQKADAELIQVE